MPSKKKTCSTKFNQLPAKTKSTVTQTHTQTVPKIWRRVNPSQHIHDASITSIPKKDKSVTRKESYRCISHINIDVYYNSKQNINWWKRKKKMSSTENAEKLLTKYNIHFSLKKKKNTSQQTRNKRKHLCLDKKKTTPIHNTIFKCKYFLHEMKSKSKISILTNFT